MIPISRLCACLCALLITLALGFDRGSSAWGQWVQPGPPTPSGNLTFTPSKIYNIIDYGAKCDGTTDDAPKINAALAAAGAAGGGRVIMPIGLGGPRICGIGSRLSNLYSNVTLECSTVGSGLVGIGPCALKKIQNWSDALTSATVVAPGTGQSPGNTFPLLGGVSTYPAKVTVSTTQVVSAVVTAGGGSCVNGSSQTVTGTTGQGQFFTANVTAAGGAITAVNSISFSGFYLTNPTAAVLTGVGIEPVIGNSCVGSTLTVTMGLATNNTVTKAIVAVGGSSGTNGSSQTVTGTTGTGTPFQALVTIASGAITAVNSISVNGNYSINPTNINNEPVTGAGLVGAALQLWVTKGVIVQQTGNYSVLPSNNVAQGTPTGPFTGSQQAGTGAGATLAATWGSAMMEVTSTPGASVQVAGSSVLGVSFKCDDGVFASYGLIVQSTRFLDVGQNYFQHCSTAALYLGTVDMVGIAGSQQNLKVFSNSMVQNSTGDGDGIWENATALANNSLNDFFDNLLLYKDGHGVRMVDSDNENFRNTHEVANSGAGYGIYITGTPARAQTVTQSSTFTRTSAGGNATLNGLGHGGVYLDGLSNMQTASFRNQFVGYDISNPIPLPTADTGAVMTGWREDGLFFGDLLLKTPIFIPDLGSYNAALAYLHANPTPGLGGFFWGGLAIVNTTGTARCNVVTDANQNFFVQPNANCTKGNFSSLGMAFKHRNVTTGTTDSATGGDFSIFWKSATAGAKAQTIFGCTAAAGVDGQWLNIKDKQGDADTRNIVITPSSGTVEGIATYTINTAKGEVSVQCDGPNTDWTVMGHQ